MVETSRAWFFLAPNLKFKEDKTERRSYNIRQYTAGAVGVVADKLSSGKTMAWKPAWIQTKVEKCQEKEFE